MKVVEEKKPPAPPPSKIKFSQGEEGWRVDHTHWKPKIIDKVWQQTFIHKDGNVKFR